jgi:hypothetical protein
VLGAAAAGCTPSPDDRDGRTAGRPAAETAAMTAVSGDSIRVELELPGSVPQGEPVAMILRVTNLLDRSVDLYLTGRPIAFDLIVMDAAGRVVWRRLQDEVVAMVLRIETLDAGAALEFTDRWIQRTNSGEAVPPGEYTVRGELLTEDRPLASSARTFRIMP